MLQLGCQLTMDSDVQGAAGSGEEGSGAGLAGHGKEVGVGYQPSASVRSPDLLNE